MSRGERMGSGGLRGLQILRSGASRVRGGFDSHAFPPILALAVALLLGVPPAPRIWADVPAPARGAARADSLAGALPTPTAGAADSLAGSGAPTTAAPDSGDGAGVREVGPRRAPTVPIAQVGRFEQPRWVMLRSLVIPAWGQVHNRAWIKAVGVAAVEWSLLAGIVNDERKLDQLSKKIDEAQRNNDEPAFDAAVLAYNDRLAATTNRRWWLGGVLAYALVDAYVDAHFRHFDVEFDTDPALPEGSDPGTGSKRQSKLGGKLSLRWTF